MTRRRLVISAFIGATVLGLAALYQGFVSGPRDLVVRTVEIAPPGWPDALDGLRVAVLSDIHTGAPGLGPSRLEQVVRETNAARPDLVLLAGDYVIQGVRGGTFVPPDETARRLAALDAPLGCFAVLGNHDWWLDAGAVTDAFVEAGIPVIDDDALAVGDGARSLWVAGISDLWEGEHDWEAALACVTDDRPVIAVTHNPDIFPELSARFALTVAGHTHGGQVALPFIGRPIVPSSYGQRYAIGHVVEDGRHLFVTPGIGTSIIPVRFRVPPEISILVLRAGG